jgi:hypothetical protein
VDMWSFGVILYILLCGYPPFRDKVEKQLFMKIRAGVYEFHPKYWSKVSDDAKDLIRKLLIVDPLQRLTVDQALAHTWLHLDGRKLSSFDLSESLSELELFQNGRKFRAGINVVLAIHRMSRSRIFDETGSANNSVPSSPIGIGGMMSPSVAGSLLHSAAVAALNASSNSTDNIDEGSSSSAGIANAHTSAAAVIAITGPFSPNPKQHQHHHHQSVLTPSPGGNGTGSTPVSARRTGPQILSSIQRNIRQGYFTDPAAYTSPAPSPSPYATAAPAAPSPVISSAAAGTATDAGVGVGISTPRSTVAGYDGDTTATSAAPTATAAGSSDSDAAAYGASVYGASPTISPRSPRSPRHPIARTASASPPPVADAADSGGGVAAAGTGVTNVSSTAATDVVSATEQLRALQLRSQLLGLQ